MKEQINRYARGTFEYEPLSAITEPEMIIAAVKKNCEQSEGIPGHAGAEKPSDAVNVAKDIFDAWYNKNH